jgi:prepilin-type N-terminal cleavage/methylation domain-containing protein
MRSTSIGTPAASRSICRDLGAGRAGFTLIEALVAMAVLLAFVSVLGPYMFHARRIAENVQGRVAAQALLRVILDAPMDRLALAKGPRDGETDGVHWSIAAEPMFVDAMLPTERPALSTPQKPKEATAPENAKDTAAKRPRWTAFRLVARVSWAPEQMVSAETVRLGVGE